jgi:hypothetical protein
MTEHKSIEEIAKLFHETYERLAPQYGYETRADTKEFDKDSPNGKLMIAVIAELIPHLNSRNLLERENNIQTLGLPCEWWANEGGKKIRFVKLPNGDVEISFINIENRAVLAKLTLASYRWKSTVDEFIESEGLK